MPRTAKSHFVVNGDATLFFTENECVPLPTEYFSETMAASWRTVSLPSKLLRTSNAWPSTVASRFTEASYCFAQRLSIGLDGSIFGAVGHEGYCSSGPSVRGN